MAAAVRPVLTVAANKVHRLFVYGSLREGMVNRIYLDEQLPESAFLRGMGKTVRARPRN
jgi:hypothetical protein